MRVVNCEQGSAEWLQIRVGKITASRIADVIAQRKRGDGELACRANYRLELIGERLSGQVAEHYVSGPMEHGTEWEPMARTAYEMEYDVEVDAVGFVLHPAMDFTGASPDGLVGTDGGIEIKCPQRETHIDWLLADQVPEEHLPQMMWNMVCCERQWWDFVSYDPSLPDGLRLFVKRMYRDEMVVRLAEEQVARFNAEVDAAMLQLTPKIRVSAAVPETIPDISNKDAYLDWLTTAIPGEVIP